MLWKFEHFMKTLVLLEDQWDGSAGLSQGFPDFLKHTISKK
jgi:hypothetical protein